MAQQAVGEAHLGAGDLGQHRLDVHLLVEADGRAITRACLHHRHVEVLLLERRVRHAELAQQLRAADLEPDEVVAVMDHAHAVRLGVARTDTDAVPCHDALTSEASARAAPVGSPPPYTAEPATNQSAPASASPSMLDGPMPPSTSMRAAWRPSSRRRRSSRTLGRTPVMNFWPPNPGFTDIMST